MYRLSDAQTSTTLGEETMILNHKAGEYFSLDEIGTLIWNRLAESPANIEELVILITEQYDIAPEECKLDILELLDNLINEKLVDQI